MILTCGRLETTLDATSMLEIIVYAWTRHAFLCEGTQLRTYVFFGLSLPTGGHVTLSFRDFWSPAPTSSEL